MSMMNHDQENYWKRPMIQTTIDKTLTVRLSTTTFHFVLHLAKPYIYFEFYILVQHIVDYSLPDAEIVKIK